MPAEEDSIGELRKRKANNEDYFNRKHKSNLSTDTLSELNQELKTTKPHREHLAIDNTYADSPRATPPVQQQNQQAADIKKNGKRYRFVNLSIRHQSSILEMKSSKESTFFGFYTLFWLTVALVIVRTTVYNYVRFRQLFGNNIMSILQKDLIPIALTDGLMYVVTYFGVFLQLAIKKGYIDWDRSGWIIQNVWQACFLFFFLWFADYMEFPWIGSVFLLLHSLVQLMKQHSYAFYNGYLWGIYNELNTSRDLLTRVERKASDRKIEGEKLDQLQEKIDFCKEELTLQSSETPFPSNITFSNYFTYSMFPTVVYQIEYPRTDRIRWTYVFEKVAAVFGVYFLMILIAENYLYPIAMRAMSLRNVSVSERLQSYPYILLDLTLPFIIMYLLVFYIIWDAILNGIAELTRFGDREFYGQWWNSVTWDQFAKDWNTPVHRFLLRHVYHSSMSAFRVSRGTATLLTFLLSSLVHELVMFSIFKKLRGYLLFLQMCQVPLIIIGRSKYLRDRKILGNVIFWVGIMSGPSLMCSLYLTF